jgi:hypothetical protein
VTGRHAYPYAGAARLVDELQQTPEGPVSGSEPSGTYPAAAPPRRSPEGVSSTPQQREQLLPGDTSTPDTLPRGATAELRVGEGVGLHSLIRRPAPAFFTREVDVYDDSIDVDEGDTWQDIVTGIRAPRAAAAHVNAVSR